MMLNFGFSGVPIYNISLDVKTVLEEKKEKQKQKKGRPTKKEEEERRSKLTPEEREQEDEEKERKRKQRKEREEKRKIKEEQKEEKQNQPKRKHGRPTKKEEEERRSKLTEEEREQEDEEKERKREEREEQKEEMQNEIERRKKLTPEERLKEEKERQEEEKRKYKEKEERKKQKNKKAEETEKEEENIKIITEENIKLIIEDFSYCLKKGPTFLTPFNKPTKMYMSVNEKKVNEPPCPKDEIFKYPSKILPETENIQWRFRVEPDHKRIGIKKLPKYPFQYFNNPDKKISTNSTRERKTLIYLEQENEKSKVWIKDKNNDLKLTREEKIKFKKDLNTKINKNLKDTETLALYEERKNTVDEVFRCFSNPEEIVNVLNENEYIHIFAFKSYPNCVRIAYKVQDDIKVCFANPLLEHM